MQLNSGNPSILWTSCLSYHTQLCPLRRPSDWSPSKNLLGPPQSGRYYLEALVWHSRLPAPGDVCHHSSGGCTRPCTQRTPGSGPIGASASGSPAPSLIPCPRTPPPHSSPWSTLLRPPGMTWLPLLSASCLAHWGSFPGDPQGRAECPPTPGPSWSQCTEGAQVECAEGLV